MGNSKVTAKGIPDRNHTGDFTSLPTDWPLTFVEQFHNARRAGPHTDYRIGTPGGMFSWALPKGLPTAVGQKHLAITQPMHAWSYNDFEGTIGKGYGTGTVKQVAKGEVVILSRTPTSIKFTRADQRNAPIYNMLKTKGGNWITFIQREDAPPEIQLYSKEHFKSVPLEEVANIMDKGALATPKFDGAGAVATIRPHGVDVYSLRRDKNGNLIRYTDHIGGLRNLKVPGDLVGRSFRGEVIATKDNKVLPPQELGGLLNSTLANVIRKRNIDNIKLQMKALALLTPKGEDYDPDKVQQLVSKLNVPIIQAPPVYRKSAEALAAIAAMRKGTHPLTGEGLVLQAPGQRPIKAKLTEDADVVIENVFPSASADPRAGGFEYSLPGQPGVKGRMGTGFTHSTLKDMLSNPEKYRGRVARIKAQGQFDSGAYRAPSFIALHEG